MSFSGPLIKLKLKSCFTLILLTINVCDIIAGNITCKLFDNDIKLNESVDFSDISHDLQASIDNLMLWSSRM